MRSFTTEAIVLKRLQFSDADYIYTVFSKEFGKFTALAKGVRKITSRRAGSLDSLNHVKLSIREDDKGFKYITEVKAVSSYHRIKTNIAASTKCFYILEVVQKYLEDDHENSELFDLLVSTFNGFNRSAIPEDLLTSRFEIMFLKSNGFEMSFGNCTNCGKTLDPSWTNVTFNYELGSIICDSCQNIYGFSLTYSEALALYKLSNNKLGKDISDVNINRISQLTRTMLLNTLGIKLKSLTFS